MFNPAKAYLDYSKWIGNRLINHPAGSFKKELSREGLYRNSESIGIPQLDAFRKNPGWMTGAGAAMAVPVAPWGKVSALGKLARTAPSRVRSVPRAEEMKIANWARELPTPKDHTTKGLTRGEHYNSHDEAGNLWNYRIPFTTNQHGQMRVGRPGQEHSDVIGGSYDFRGNPTKINQWELKLPRPKNPDMLDELKRGQALNSGTDLTKAHVQVPWHWSETSTKDAQMRKEYSQIRNALSARFGPRVANRMTLKLRQNIMTDPDRRGFHSIASMDEPRLRAPKPKSNFTDEEKRKGLQKLLAEMDKNNNITSIAHPFNRRK